MEHWEKKANGWVFLSHSSKDYENVKIVRNYLEESGFSALMFYLKCLEDDDKKDEAQKLIEWEIEKRNIFVLCDSFDARSSPWVQDEINYVKSFPEKIYVEIDMDKLKYEKCTQLSKLDNLMKQSTLFFSSSYEDKKFVMQVYKYLKSEGFKIWIDGEEMKSGDNISEKINKGLENSRHILLFISQNYINSEWTMQEIEFAIASNTSILTMIIDNTDISDLPVFIQNTQVFKINDNNFINKKKELLMEIKKLGMK